MKIEHLLPNTTYNIYATVINESEYTYITRNETISFKTLDRNYIPGNITNIRVGNFILNQHTNMFDVEIEWDPAKGINKYYLYKTSIKYLPPQLLYYTEHKLLFYNVLNI